MAFRYRPQLLRIIPLRLAHLRITTFQPHTPKPLLQCKPIMLRHRLMDMDTEDIIHMEDHTVGLLEQLQPE
jgi:hypothetical protein